MKHYEKSIVGPVRVGVDYNCFIYYAHEYIIIENDRVKEVAAGVVCKHYIGKTLDQLIDGINNHPNGGFTVTRVGIMHDTPAADKEWNNAIKASKLKKELV